MAEWLGSGRSELHAPLLAEEGGGGGDGPASNTTTATADERRERRDREALSAVAVLSAADRRRNSAASAASRHRRRRLSTIQSRASSISRRVSEVSAASDEVTHRIDSLTSHDRRSYGRSDTEITDYGTESDYADMEKEVPREALSTGALWKAVAVVVVTAAGIATYVAAMVYSITLPAVSTAATVAVGVAGGWSALVPTPMVWVGEWRLTHMPALRKRVNDLRELAERFRREIETLEIIKADLRVEVESLQEDSDELERLMKKNGGNVDSFISLVRENQVILLQMKENMRQAVLQEVVRLVLQSDIDRDGVISRKEADILARRMSMSLEIYGIVFDEAKFHRAVGLSPSLAGVMTIVKRLLPDERDRVSTFYDSAVSDSSDEEEEGVDDVYDMFYIPVEDRLTRGDADAICLCREYLAKRGEQPTLISVAPGLGKSVHGLRCSVSGSEIAEL